MVKIEATGYHANGLARNFGGSGFIVRHDGYVLTCAHVIPDAKDYVGTKVWVIVGQTKIPAEEIDRLDQYDLALLKLPPAQQSWPAVHVGDSTKIEQDAWLYAMGFTKYTPMLGLQGWVSQTDDGKGHWILNIEVNPGMSGGPVFNEQGEVVGVIRAGIDFLDSVKLVRPLSFAANLLDAIGGLSSSAPEPPGVSVLLFVSDLQRIPISGVQLASTGLSEITEPTSIDGKTLLLLQGEVGVGRRVSLTLIPPASDEWILANDQIHVPARDDRDAVRVVMVSRKTVYESLNAALDLIDVQALKQGRGATPRELLVAYSLLSDDLDAATTFRVLRDFERSSQNLYEQAAINLLKGDFEDAESFFASVVRFETSIGVTSAKGYLRALLEQGKGTEAASIAERVASFVPADPVLNALIAEAYLGAGRKNVATANAVKLRNRAEDPDLRTALRLFERRATLREPLPSNPMSDREIERDIQRLLTGMALEVKVESWSGFVTVSGDLSGAERRNLNQNILAEVPGVIAVLPGGEVN